MVFDGGRASQRTDNRCSARSIPSFVGRSSSANDIIEFAARAKCRRRWRTERARRPSAIRRPTYSVRLALNSTFPVPIFALRRVLFLTITIILVNRSQSIHYVVLRGRRTFDYYYSLPFCVERSLRGATVLLKNFEMHVSAI